MLIVLLASRLAAQQNPNSSVSTQGVLAERDKGKEDEIAAFFEKTRSGLKSPHLSRIEYRDILEEEICTVALSGAPASIYHDPAEFAIYKTSRPDVLGPELNRVASYDVLYPKNRSGYRRYSVAVWRTKDRQTEEITYWVGVNLYWSAPMEFLDYHFTDGIHDRKNREKKVAPQCRVK